jgi:ATP-dependent RNA helicase MSS116, mitochondrial
MDTKLFRPGRTIGMIVIAPTRELVIQISQQASTLLSYQYNGFTVQSLYGGGSIQRDRAILLNRQIPSILVATPGRLHDLLRDSSSFRVYGNRNFIDVINECPIVIYDEADRLMDGFVSEMKTISSYLLRVEKRQTMLFSATISSKLKFILQNGYPKILPSDYVTIDCVNDHDITTQTNQRVSQSFIQLCDMTLYVSGFLSIVHYLMQDNSTNHLNQKSKVIVFLPTAKLVKFFSEVLYQLKSLSTTTSTCYDYDIYSIHSRMSQGSRNRASTQFRRSNHQKPCILLSSDVSARGVDYPDVTYVVQVQ